MLYCLSTILNFSKGNLMYYITLDLEWNQAYAQKAIAVQKQLCCRLRGEVIQIGAVKLDEELNPCGSYQIIVRPKYFKKMHRHVSVLTGITQEQMDLGVSLPEAAESFRKWCGEDFAFLTWGPDDIPMLEDNFRIHKLPYEWLRRTYDLQHIFGMECGEPKKQRSLEYAMEYYGIPQTLPAHDALNDAYFTALVAARINVKEGIKKLSDPSAQNLSEWVIGDADAGDDGYVTTAELLADEAVRMPPCPICREKMQQLTRARHTKGQKYTSLVSCKQDGTMFLTLRLHKNFNETWRARAALSPATEEEIAEYKAAVQQDLKNRKAYRRPRRRQYKNGSGDGGTD